MKKNTRIYHIRTLATILAVIFALPLPFGIFSGIFAWFSPFIALNSVFLLKGFVWLNILSFSVLVLSIIRKNWFCRILCPVGWSCDLISGLAPGKTSRHGKLPDLSRWIALISLGSAITGLPLFILLDPLAIFHGFFTSLSGSSAFIVFLSLSGLPVLLLLHLFFPGLWCGKLCPLGGLQEIIRDIRGLFRKPYRKSSGYEPSLQTGRRYFLASGTGLIAGLLVPQILKAREASFIRPPASTKPVIFNTLCIRCGNCIKACPTDIITHHQTGNDILSWMTPEVVFRDGYCLETCNLCGQVCPSGAITLFSKEAKRRIFMGTAVIHLENCLLLKNKECDRCKVSCKYDALEMVPDVNNTLMVPSILKDRCVGCGACAVICPENTISIVPSSV